MKISKRQLRQIIESYNSMSPAGEALAKRAKRQFTKDYPDVRVGIDMKNGWILVNSKKAVNMSQASGRPIDIDDIIDKMKQAYLGHPVNSTSSSLLPESMNPAMVEIENELRHTLAEYIDTYMMSMNMNPGDAADRRRVSRRVDDIVSTIIGN